MQPIKILFIRPSNAEIILTHLHRAWRYGVLSRIAHMSYGGLRQAKPLALPEECTVNWYFGGIHRPPCNARWRSKASDAVRAQNATSRQSIACTRSLTQRRMAAKAIAAHLAALTRFRTIGADRSWLGYQMAGCIAADPTRSIPTKAPGR